MARTDAAAWGLSKSARRDALLVVSLGIAVLASAFGVHRWLERLDAEQLGRMVDDIARTADIAQGLAGVAATQAKGAQSLGQSVTELSSAAQQNAESLEQLSKTASQLSAQAAQLDELMGVFRVEG